MDLTRVTPDVDGLKALSHPTRLRMLGMLRSDGPATASSLAARLGLNSGATSYHLRHLARHGFIEDDAERGNGRERWWRAAHQSTSTGVAESAEEREAQDAFTQAVAVVHTEQLQRAVEEWGLMPQDWRAASTTSDWGLILTPARARALLDALDQVMADAQEDEDDPQAGHFVVQLHTFPRPGTVTPEAPEAGVSAYRVFLILTFTRWFPVGLVVALLGLWKLDQGLSVAQALTSGAVSGLAILLLELPTSGFADTYGRRPLLVVAGAVGVLSSVVYLLATSFWMFVVASVLQGVYRALDSGPLEAWFVDTVHLERPGADVDQELSRAGTVLGGAMALGALLAGLLVWWDPLPGSALRLPMVLWAVLGAVHLVAIVLFMQETPRQRPGRADPWEGAREVRQVIVGGFTLALRNRILLALLGAEAAMSLLMIGFEQFVPLRLAELLDSTERAGAVMGPTAAAGWGVFAGGAALGGVLARRWGLARAALLTHLLTALGVVGIGLALGPATLVMGYVVAYGLFGSTGPLHAALIHREAKAENRATVLSLGSMASFAVFSSVAPLAGLLAGSTSTGVALLALGAVGGLGCLFYLPAARSQRVPVGVSP